MFLEFVIHEVILILLVLIIISYYHLMRFLDRLQASFDSIGLLCLLLQETELWERLQEVSSSHVHFYCLRG